MSETGPRVLVVDDEQAIRRFLRAILTAQGYTIFEAAGGKEAIQTLIAQRPDLVILDLGLPDLDGVTITRQIREWSQVPILILSVRDAEQDKIDALDAGADDYLTKPFGAGELLARLRVALRRVSQPVGEPVFQSGGLSIDLARRLVTVSGQGASLTPTEYDLLRILVLDAGKVLTHRLLFQRVWGTGYQLDLHLLRVNISNLRRKIEPDPSRPRYIVTEPGVGYRLRLDG